MSLKLREMVYYSLCRGGGSRGDPPPLLGTPKLHKEEKKVVHVRVKTPHFSN